MLVLLGLLLVAPVPKATPTPPPVLAGRVLGPGEKPLQGSLLLAGRPGETPRRTRTDAKGTFRIELPDPRPLAVLVEAADLAPAELSGVEPGLPLTVRLAPGTTLRGTVRDARGEPVPGASLELGLERNTLATAAGSPLRQASTDARGAFRLPALPPGPFRLLARAPGFGELRLRHLAGDRPLELVLTRASWLTGQVTDGRGKPVAGAQVRLASTGRGSEARRARSDAAGRFSLPFPGRDGPLRVAARGEATAPALSPLLTSAEVPSNLVLPRGTRVSGRVVDEESRPLAGRLELLELDGEAHPALAELVRAVAGPDGRFVLDRLPPGTHTVGLAVRGRATRALTLVIGNRNEQDVGDLALEAGLAVTGHVHDEEGAPVAKARVVASHTDENTVRSVDTESEPDGRFRLAGLPEGPVRLRVDSPGFGPASARAVAGGPPVDITLRPGGALAGAVVDELDRPLPSFAVEVESEGTGSLRRDVVAADGRFQVEGLSPGRHLVTVRAVDRAPATAPDVDVIAGATTDVGLLRLGSGLSLRVRVVGASGSGLPGATVRAVRGAGINLEWSAAREGRTDLGGTVELLGLSAGSYLVTASHEDRVPAEAGPIELEAGQPAPEVRVVLGEGGRIEGSVRRRGAPLPGARIEVWSEGSAQGSTSGTVSDGAGRFEVDRVRPGSARLGLVEAGSSLLTTRVEVREDETSQAELELRDVLVHGRVTRGGEPVGGARVEVRAVDASPMFVGGDPLGAETAPRYHRARTRPDGTFELLLATPGRHLARVDPADGADLPAREVEVPDVPDFGLLLDFPASGVKLAGTVADADGAPLADAGVLASPQTHQGQRAVHGRSGPDGSFVLEVDPGPYRLQASARGHQTRSREVEVGEAGVSGVRIELPSGQSLRGRVVDGAGAGAPGLEVMATAAAGSGYAMTGHDGRFEMDGLAAAPHALGSATRDGRFAFLLLSPSEEDATLLLLPGGRVELEVVGPGDEPQAGAHASVTGLSGAPVEFPELWGETDGRGRIERPVPAGRVELAVEAHGLAGRVVVEVPAGALVAARIRLQPAGPGR